MSRAILRRSWHRATSSPAAAIATLVIVGLIVFYLVQSIVAYEVDLGVYRSGAAAAWKSPALYDTGYPPFGLPFTYPPFAAFVFTPLAFVPAPLAQFVFALISIGCTIAFCIVCIRQYLPDLAPRPELGALRDRIRDRSAYVGSVAIVVAVLISDPLRVGLGFGQINTILALMMILDLVNRSGRLPQGLLIGIAAAIKLTPLFLLVYFVATRRIRAAAVGVATFAVMTGIGWVAFPHASAEYWGGVAFDSSRVGGVAYISNQSINGTLVRLLGGSHAAQLPWLACAGIGAVVVLLVCRHLYSVVPDLCNASALATMLLVSPVSWTHHWVVILPLVLAGFQLGKRWNSAVVLVLTTVLSACLLVGAIWAAPSTNDQEYGHSTVQFLVGNSYVLLTAALILVLLGSAWRRRAALIQGDVAVEA